jgi:hypothetical protein
MPGLCDVVEPALAPVATGQMAACFLYPEVRAASNIPESASVARATPASPVPVESM